MRSPRLCGTLRLTCRRCLPRLLTNEVALTPAASPPGESSLHDCTSFDLQGRRCQLAWSPATPPTRPPLALRRSPRQRTSRPVSAAYASQTALIASRCRVVREGCLADRAKEDIGQVVSVAWVRGSDRDTAADLLLPTTPPTS